LTLQEYVGATLLSLTQEETLDYAVEPGERASVPGAAVRPLLKLTSSRMRSTGSSFEPTT
jgi:hypothetical protein